MNQLPAHLAARRPNALTQAVQQGLSSGSPPMISIRGNRFTLVDAAGNERALQTLFADVVIVQANPHLSKVYYESAFDPSATDYKPPTCFSDNGMAPSRQALKPQSQTCAACPNNVWGSDVSRVSGKATKACNDAKKIAVVMSDNPDMAFLLRVPPASLKHLSAYVKTVAAQNAGNRQVEVSDVITRVSFDPQVQGVLNFAPVGWIDERTAAAMEKIWEAKAADDLVGLNDTPYQGPIGLAAPVAQQHPQGQLAPPPQPMQHSQQPAPQLAPAATQPAPAPQVPTQAVGTPATPTPRGRGRPKKDPNAQPTFMQEPAVQAQPMQAVQSAPAIPQINYAASQSFFGGQTTGTPLAAQGQGLAQVPELPAFLRRDQPTAPAAPAPQERFGMAQAPQPNAELSAAIDKALNLPLPKG